MTTAAMPFHPPRHFTRFVRSPKGLLLIILGGFAILAGAYLGTDSLTQNLFIAIVTAAAIDVTVVAIQEDRWAFPDGAILTGAIIAFILRPEESPSVIILSVTAALASKHLLRTHWSNIFNPAAVALVFSGIVLGAGQSWWGSLPDLAVPGALLVLLTGAFMADRINKLPMVLVFLGTYFGLFSIAALFGTHTELAEIYRAPDVHAALFFTLFMLDDPPTSPVRYKDQVVYALIVATLAYLIFMTLGAVYYLPLALLAGNAWESGRRLYDHSRRHSRRQLPLKAKSVSSRRASP